MYWIYGLLTSLVIGHFVTGFLLTWVRESILNDDEFKKKINKDKWYVKLGLHAYPKVYLWYLLFSVSTLK